MAQYKRKERSECLWKYIPKPSDLVDIKTKFNANFVVADNGCWEWTGKLSPSGYGYINDYYASFDGKRSWSGHRLSYRIHKGEIPKGLLVCHKCNNRKCVNPDHLYAGTVLKNYLDAVEVKTVPIRKLTPDQVREIRYLFTLGYGEQRLSRMFKISEHGIADIKKGKSYRDIEGVATTSKWLAPTLF